MGKLKRLNVISYEKKQKVKEEKALKYKNNPKFNFTLVDGIYAEDELSESVNELNQFSLDLGEYETYMFVKYFYNYYKHIFKIHKTAMSESAFQHVLLDLFRLITLRKWEKEIKITPVRKLEEKVNKLPEVKELLEKSFEKDGFPNIKSTVLINNSTYQQLTKDFFKNFLKELKGYLTTNKIKSLEKKFYSENLHTYLHLLGITDKKIRNITEFVFYSQLTFFQSYMPRMNGNLSDICRFTNIDNLLLSDILSYSNILFDFDTKNSTKTTVIFCKNVGYKCFVEYRKKSDFMDIFMPKLKNTDLVEKDFEYIPQIKYIKSLLEDALKNNRVGVNILLYGDPGCGKTALSRVLIKSLNTDGYEVETSPDKQSLMSARLSNENRTEEFIIMNNMLKSNKNCVVLYDEAEDFFRKKDESSQAKGYVNTFLEQNKIPTIWTTNSLHCMEKSFLRRFTYVLNIEQPPLKVYENILNKILNKYELKLEESIKAIYLQYRPSLGIIEKTIANFINSGSKDQKQLEKDILDTLQAQAYGEKQDKIKRNKFVFNPKLLNTSEDLEKLVENIKNTNRLDFSMLLYGVPGSSKTSFGRYLGEQLGLNVISKTYTELSSCWVGETEKNIKNLFEEAEKGESLIILDEADVLLQDRTKAARSWEISAVEALLTCMEDHPYPFIMTTNLYNNLDPAVMRRFLYKVKHDYLNKQQIKEAFKHFFDIEIEANLHLSKLTSGDFAVVKKQAEFENRLLDKDWLIERLENEMNQKKALDIDSKITL